MLGSRKGIKIPGGKHEVLPILNYLDHADLQGYAIKYSKDAIIFFIL